MGGVISVTHSDLRFPSRSGWSPPSGEVKLHVSTRFQALAEALDGTRVGPGPGMAFKGPWKPRRATFVTVPCTLSRVPTFVSLR